MPYGEQVCDLNVYAHRRDRTLVDQHEIHHGGVGGASDVGGIPGEIPLRVFP